VLGKTVVVTGASSGIGRATAVELGRQGARVLLVARDRERGERALADVLRAGGTGECLVADLSRQKDVRRLAADILDRNDRVHVLVNNAGAMHGRRMLTEDGFERTFALNHLAYFLLTNLLRGALVAAAPSRVVNVASHAHFFGRIHWDDLNLARNYGPWRAYAQSKLANVLFTYELARRWEDEGVTANAVHPGTVATNFARGPSGRVGALLRLARPFLLSPEQGARTVLWAASAPKLDAVTGQYFYRRRAFPSSRRSRDEEAQRRLWEQSEEWTGLSTHRSAFALEGERRATDERPWR